MFFSELCHSIVILHYLFFLLKRAVEIANRGNVMKTIFLTLLFIATVFAVDETVSTSSIREQLQPYLSGEKETSPFSDSLVLLLFAEKNPILKRYWNSDVQMHRWRGVKTSQKRVYTINFKNYNSASTTDPILGLGTLYIPEEIYLLQKLKNFYSDGPKIVRLPSSLKNMPNLDGLCLMKAGLKKVPKVVAEMTQLRMLQLTDNSIEEFPVDFKNVGRLQTLHLSQNKLHSLPKEMVNIRTLKHLNLKGNNFTEIPAILTEFPALSSVNLSNNKIKQLNEVPLRGENMTTYSLYNNPFDRIPEPYGDYYITTGKLPVYVRLKAFKKHNIPEELTGKRRGRKDIHFIGSSCHFGGNMLPYSFEMVGGFLDDFNNLGGHVLFEPGYGGIKYGIGMHFKPLKEALPMPYFTDVSLRLVGTSLSKKNKRFGKSQFVGVEAAFVHNVGLKIGYHRNLDEKRNEVSIQLGASLMYLLSKIDLNFPG